MFSSILMVCTGNICRSPMAEGLARARFPNARVQSAGLAALVGHSADPLAVELLKERGLDISAHKARQLSSQMVREFELILVMESWQVREIDRLAPHARGKVFRLGHWRDFEVPDPYKQPRDAFQRSLDGILRGLEDLEKVMR
ncbi:MAG: low molecular weight protein-tyrosine-phosphatase [Myxococcaceae bacterium]